MTECQDQLLEAFKKGNPDDNEVVVALRQDAIKKEIQVGALQSRIEEVEDEMAGARRQADELADGI